jgi:hypothetical protein
MNQFDAMAQYKRDWFVNLSGSWHAWITSRGDSPPTIEVYLGGVVGDGVCTQCVGTNPESGVSDVFLYVDETPEDGIRDPIQVRRYITGCDGALSAAPFDPRRSEHVDYALHNILSWIPAGVTSVWLDDVGSNSVDDDYKRRRWGAMELAYHPILRQLGISVGIETLPLDGRPGMVNAPDWCSVNKVRSLTTDLFTLPFYPAHNTWVFGRQGENHFDATTVGPDPDKTNFQTVGEARRRGMVVTLGRCGDDEEGRKLCGLVQRWYSMGWIYLPDFNADGRVNAQDLADFNTAAATPAPIPPLLDLKVYATCDIDGDGVRETGTGGDDRTGFENAYYAHVAAFGADAANQPFNPALAWWADYGEANDL